MAYNKTNWVNGETPVNASNLNKIEEGIYQNSLDVATNSSSIGNLANLDTSVKTDLVNAVNETSMEVSTGSGTGYTYMVRKYGNGIMEIDISVQTTTTINGAWGNAYITNNIDTPNYPVAFISAPFLYLSVYSDGNDGAWAMNGGRTGTKDYPPKINLVRGSALASAKTFYIQIHAVGKWK